MTGARRPLEAAPACAPARAGPAWGSAASLSPDTPPLRLDADLREPSVPRRIRVLLRDVAPSEAGMRMAAEAGATSDDALVTALTSGEIEALDWLYERYAPLTFSVALRVLGDRQLAEDVAQDVFLRFWRQP
ncbi:MAG: hypothetical protein EXR65_00880 [Dehalococcoidia bacterium]|nr:hypothetical protein [Dehalococcoidia bacterium]